MQYVVEGGSLAALLYTAFKPGLKCQWDERYPPLKDDRCFSHTEEKKSCQGERCSWSQRQFSNFSHVVDNIASSLGVQDNYDNIVSRATHEPTGGNEISTVCTCFTL